MTCFLQIPLVYSRYIKSHDQNQISNFMQYSNLKVISAGILKENDGKPISIAIHFMLSTPASEKLKGSDKISIKLSSFAGVKSSNTELQTFSFKNTKTFEKLENRIEKINSNWFHVGPSSSPLQREYYQIYELANVEAFDKPRRFAVLLDLIKKETDPTLEFEFILGGEGQEIRTSFQLDPNQIISDMIYSK